MKTKHTVTKNADTIEEIPLKDIVISPFNAERWGNKPPNEESLAELAASIKSHGVIQSVVLRKIEGGKYELVVGERRYRASIIAENETIRATIQELTDEQVQEIQLIENMQREDPHPMSEAINIQKLLALKHINGNFDEVARRIGKSVAFAHQRAKLCSLIDSFREMYFANYITTSQALKLARLDEESQNDFFVSNCEGWKEKNWSMRNFDYLITNYQLNLKNAPFSIRDGKLDKTVGACTKCPNNTAVTTSLFPEDSKDARCTNRPCYENKCRLTLLLKLAAVLKENENTPIAVEDETILATYFSNDDKLIKGRSVLVKDIDFNSMKLAEKMPERKDYDYNDDEDENESDFAEAMEEYLEEQNHIIAEVESGHCEKAILIRQRNFGRVAYVYNKSAVQSLSESGSQNHEFRAKDYQEAVKNKTLTAEIVNGERKRLTTKEVRSKEIDEMKLQVNFYEALQKFEAGYSAAHPSGISDKAVAIFILYDSLGYDWKKRFTDTILERSESRADEHDNLFHFFFNASEQEISVLTRFAILSKSEVKSPNGHAGQLLRVLVDGTEGMDAGELVRVQNTVTKERENKLHQKFLILDKQAETVK
jgi:ParB family chromosome partitioning protein